MSARCTSTDLPSPLLPANVPTPSALVTQESATDYVQQKAEEIKPKLRAAMAGAEPSIQEFLKHPDVEYLKQNPDVIVVVCEILAFLGIPGAASICMLIGMSGPADMLIPLVMAMAGPVASLRVSESGFLK
jgi:hypothetical protein